MEINLFKIMLVFLFVFYVGESQVFEFPFIENFDSVVAPAVPANWSLDGFTVSSSTSRSLPNSLSATGDMNVKRVVTPYFNFYNRIPDKLIFWERRSSTALKYCLEIRASTDGLNYNILLAVFDTISSTSNYVQRVVDLKSYGLQYQSSVRFQLRIVDGKNNNTGVLRVDDFSVTLAVVNDIELRSINIFPSNPTRNDMLTISVLAKNNGLISVPNFSIRFYLDRNRNNLLEAEEQLSLLSDLLLEAQDSMFCNITCPPQFPGAYRITAAADFPEDENRVNDTIKGGVYVGCEAGDIVINEIMYAPLENQNEWIELYNTSSYEINLSQWRITDRPTKSGVNSHLISNRDVVLSPHRFAVIAADSSIYDLFPDLLFSNSDVCIIILNCSGGLSLNNDGDAVVLKDYIGKTVDSVEYSPKWHNPDFQSTRGRSLERINPSVNSNDPRNWSTCTRLAGGSPGSINSIFTAPANSKNQTKNIIKISPNPFSPDGDGFEDFCLVHYELPMSFAIINVRIYDIKGRLVRSLANGEIVGAKGDDIATAIVVDGAGDVYVTGVSQGYEWSVFHNSKVHTEAEVGGEGRGSAIELRASAELSKSS